MVFTEDFVITYLVDEDKQSFFGTVKLSTEDWLESTAEQLSPEGIVKVGKMVKEPKL